MARASVTLHVGAGTFQPVRSENIAEHRDAQRVVRRAGLRPSPPSRRRARAAGAWSRSARRRCARSNRRRKSGRLSAGARETDIFITPGFTFRVVDALVTNFHLPRSTLLMLVSAFAGHAHMHALYAHAVRERYRFFSYGDAMLLARGT